MNIAAVIVSLVLAVAVLASGSATLAKVPAVLTNITAVGWPADRAWILGLLKVLGGIGLIVGIWVPAIGIAAAVGIVLYFVGAIVFHLRAHNHELAPAGGLLVLAVVALVLQIAAA